MEGQRKIPWQGWPPDGKGFLEQKCGSLGIRLDLSCQDFIGLLSCVLSQMEAIGTVIPDRR